MPKGKQIPQATRERAVQLLSEGMSYLEVSIETGISRRWLYKLAIDAKKAGIKIPDRRVKPERNCAKYVYINTEAAVAFELEAEARGLSGGGALINRVLRVIAKEPNLISAILDEPEPVCETRAKEESENVRARS
jgi:hypothetical protein